MTNSRSRARSKLRRWVEYTLLLAGVAGLSVWAWSVASKAVYQDWGNWAFDRQMRGESATVPGYLSARKAQLWANVRRLWEKPSHPPAPSPDLSVSIPTPAPPAPAIGNEPIENNGLVGRLSIPRLRVSSVVREGVGEDTLRIALGHIPGTAMPGQEGNVGLAGHRDTIFRPLRDIRKNDLIQLETVHGNYTYQVESTAIVKPEDVSVLKAIDRPVLTLVTCYPFYYVGSAPDRFIVKAVQLTREPAAQVPVQQADIVTPAAPPPPELNSEPSPQPKPELDRGLRRIAFEVRKGSSRQLAPGISLGLTGTDPYAREIDGWMWLMPDRRTIWLRAKGTHSPEVFYSGADGLRRELRITRVTDQSVSGYLLVPDRRTEPAFRVAARRPPRN